MNREDIIRMAREAGFEAKRGDGLLDHVPEDVFAGPVNITREIKLFFQAAYAAGAAEEREACAKVADENAFYWSGYKIAAAIRARGEMK